MTLTVERLREVLDYDPRTGFFTWKVRLSPHCRIGKRAGANSPKHYRSIRIDGVMYLEHRLAWFYVHGVWPAGDLDHKNLQKRENWLDNLRPASRSQNKMNTAVRADNKLGIKGVCFDKKARKYRAVITLDGETTTLGWFEEVAPAQAAYEIAARRLFGEFART